MPEESTTTLAEVDDDLSQDGRGGYKTITRNGKAMRTRGPDRVTRHTRNIADNWIRKGNRTPLEVMLRNMQYFDQKADELVRKADEWLSEPESDEEWKDRMKLLAAVKQNRLEAQECARDCAPFMHHKLQAVDIAQKDDKPWSILISPGDDEL